MKVTWSHSSLKDYEGCPRRYQEVKVLKNFPFIETDATKYGTEFHKAAEDYIQDGVVLPDQFMFAKPTLDALVAKPGRKLCELQMAPNALRLDKSRRMGARHRRLTHHRR